jgi:hypothetical protein
MMSKLGFKARSQIAAWVAGGNDPAKKQSFSLTTQLRPSWA